MERVRIQSRWRATRYHLLGAKKKVILKSDGETLVTSLKEAVGGSRDVSLGAEVSPEGDSQANGEIDRAIRTVKGQLRTLKSALGNDYMAEFGENHALMPWLVACAYSLICKFNVYADGKTSHERCRGRKFNEAMPEFGERAIYLKTPSKGKSGIEARLDS